MTTTALVVLESCSHYRLRNEIPEYEEESTILSIENGVYNAKSWGKKTFTSVPGMLCTGTLPQIMKSQQDWDWVNPFFLDDLYEYTNPYIALPNPWGGSTIWPLIEQYDETMAEKNRCWVSKRNGKDARFIDNCDETTSRPPSEDVLADFDDWESDHEDWFLYFHVQETHNESDYVNNPVQYADDVVSRVLEYNPDNIVVTADHSEHYSDDVFRAHDSDDLWERDDNGVVTGMK